MHITKPVAVELRCHVTAFIIETFTCTNNKVLWSHKQHPPLIVIIYFANLLHWIYTDQSTCSIFALCPHHWFQDWSDRAVKRRGYEYESLKKALGQTIWKQCEMLFPQLVGKVSIFPKSDCYVSKKHSFFFNFEYFHLPLSSLQRTFMEYADEEICPPKDVAYKQTSRLVDAKFDIWSHGR